MPSHIHIDASFKLTSQMHSMKKCPRCAYSVDAIYGGLVERDETAIRHFLSDINKLLAQFMCYRITTIIQSWLSWTKLDRAQFAPEFPERLQTFLRVSDPEQAQNPHKYILPQ